MVDLSPVDTPAASPLSRKGWPHRIPRAGVLWAACYAAVQLVWVISGTDVPWSPQVSEPSWLLLVRGLLAVLAGAACLAVARRRSVGRRWFVRPALLVAIPALASGMISLPAQLVTVAAGAGVDSVPAAVQVLLSTIGLCLLGPTVLVSERDARGACARCGRQHAGEANTVRHPSATPASRRTTTLAGILAAGLLPWALTKTVWWLGGTILGAPAEAWRAANSAETPVVAALGALGIDVTVLAAGVAVVLLLALLYTWGQVFPRWVPFGGGRRVPRLTVLLPAWLCGFPLATYGAVLVVYVLLIGAGLLPAPEVSAPFTSTAGVTWMTLFGGLAFGGLGGGLLVAARSYARRTRPWCGRPEGATKRALPR
ncbi:hypothetical protein [Ruania zhangjianzhongii]|uniref:hypothetical protein n=1 Tax=Ruania zhangjianzhongii TaxID=2603206 RepID=UPI001AF0167F|nr:hypothetical protein [Ruania zhangjianzhongii]